MNPALMETIAQTRITEMRRTAATRSGRPEYAGRIPAETPAKAVTPGTHGPAAARQTLGLFLVRVGLRLALPRGLAASAR